jgi:hypothetical protein
MTSHAKKTANATNALNSTGPTTDAGKAVTRMNAVSHGLRSPAPVVPGENPAEWDAFRDGTISSLAPVGDLEAELAGRVAALFWRLRRVIRFEAGTTAAAVGRVVGKVTGAGDPADPLTALANRVGGMTNRYSVAGRRKELADKRDRLVVVEADAATLRGLTEGPKDAPLPGDAVCRILEEAADEEEMPDAIDHELWAAVGVPEEWHENPVGWGGWTTGHLKAGFVALAKYRGQKPGPLLDLTARRRAREVIELNRELPGLEAGLAQAEADIAGAVAAAHARGAIPDKDTVEKLCRYESHLHRQLVQTLHLLERLQNVRAGNPVPPPMAVDVTIEAGEMSAGTG